MDRRRFLLVTGAAALAGCGTDGSATVDDVPLADDAAPDAAPDASLDDLPPLDDAPDASVDASDDARVDGGTTSPMSIAEDAMAFPLGVMAGEMTAAAALVWTRFAGAGELSLRVYDGDDRVVLDRPVTPEAAGYAHVAASGLRAGAAYRYAFVRREGGRDAGRSAIGRFRTAPADDDAPVVTFAGTSCTHQRARPFPTMQHAGGRGDLDFFVHGGDLTYCDGARSLDDYRAKYAENLTSAGLRALLSSTGLYATWDDHEVDNNFNPETISASQLANARAAYFEHHPQARDPSAPDRIWRTFRWGRTLELFVLDCRGERRPSSRTRPDAQYISRAQMDWLKAGLAASRATFKFIVNSVPIANFPLLFDFGAADRWEGYAAQRREILEHIASRAIEGVWWLSGDFHLGCIGRVEPSGPYSAQREVLMGPGGNNANPLYTSLLGDQWEFKTGESNYTVLRCDPAARAVTITFVNGSGRELFSRRYE